jgi:hypothetical protein
MKRNSSKSKISKSVTLSAFDTNNNRKNAIASNEKIEQKKCTTVENLHALEQVNKESEDKKLKHSASFSRYLYNIEQGRFDDPYVFYSKKKH